MQAFVLCSVALLFAYAQVVFLLERNQLKSQLLEVIIAIIAHRLGVRNRFELLLHFQISRDVDAFRFSNRFVNITMFFVGKGSVFSTPL